MRGVMCREWRESSRVVVRARMCIVTEVKMKCQHARRIAARVGVLA